MQLRQNCKKIWIKGREGLKGGQEERKEGDSGFQSPGEAAGVRTLNAQPSKLRRKPPPRACVASNLLQVFWWLLQSPFPSTTTPLFLWDWQSRGGGFSRHSLSHDNQPPASPPGRRCFLAERGSRTRGTGNRAAGGEQAGEPGQLTGSGAGVARCQGGVGCVQRRAAGPRAPHVLRDWRRERSSRGVGGGGAGVGGRARRGWGNCEQTCFASIN